MHTLGCFSSSPNLPALAGSGSVTGDFVYKDILFAYYPSTDPEAYLDSLEKVAALPVKNVFLAHHSLDIQPEILTRMRDALRNFKMAGKLHHGCGTIDYGDWGVWL